jgi:ribosomal protein L37E
MNPDREVKDLTDLEDDYLTGEGEITRLDLHRGSEHGTLPDGKPTQETEESTVCARCGAELQFLTTMAWCLSCGYTREVHSDSHETTTQEMQEDLDVRRYLSLLHSQSERYKLEVQLSNLKRGEGYLHLRGLEWIPEWFAVLVCGLLICAVGSFVVAMNLRTSPDERLLWCLCQAGAGGFLVVLAQPLAWVLVVPRRLRFREFKMLFHPWMWLMAWRGLPQTRYAIWAGVWGMGLIAGAAFIHAASLYGWI